MRLTVENLGVRLGGRTIFEGLSFTWDAPGAFAITGPNGAGKSTLLKVLAGLLKPRRGDVRWHAGGRELTPAQARARLGFASPEMALYEDLTAQENLAFFAHARGLPWDRAQGLAWLERLGLAGRGDERLATYSSGMKQRVKLAFALQARPGLVLLDEPGSNLDEAGRNLLSILVREAVREALVVIATNDADEAALASSELVLGGSARSVRRPADEKVAV